MLWIFISHIEPVKQMTFSSETNRSGASEPARGLVSTRRATPAICMYPGLVVLLGVLRGRMTSSYSRGKISN